MYSYAILLIDTASTLFITVLYIDCAPLFLVASHFYCTCIGQLSNVDFVIFNIWRWLRPNTYSCMGYHCIGELRGGGTTTPPRCHIVGKKLNASWRSTVKCGSPMRNLVPIAQTAQLSCGSTHNTAGGHSLLLYARPCAAIPHTVRTRWRPRNYCSTYSGGSKKLTGGMQCISPPVVIFR